MIQSKPQISAIEMPHFDRVLQMEQGYVLNFSDRTFASFFAEELAIDIYDKLYASNGPSKAKRLRCFMNTASAHTVARALRRLLQHRQDLGDQSAATSWAPVPTLPDPAELMSIRKVEGVKAGAILPR